MKQEIDEIVLFYGDHVLRKSDISLLAPGNWLNDLIIDFALERIIKDSNQFQAFTCSMTKLLCDIPSLDLMNSILPSIDKKYTLFPVNDHRGIQAGGTHWSLLMLKDKKEFYYFDSIHNRNLDSAISIQKRICGWQSISFKPLDIVDCPKQKNSSDCGAFLCQYSHSLISAIDQFDFKSLNVLMTSDEMRLWILNEIEQLKERK